MQYSATFQVTETSPVLQTAYKGCLPLEGIISVSLLLTESRSNFLQVDYKSRLNIASLMKDL